MYSTIDQLFGARLDATIPETWTTLDYDQLMKFKQCFATMTIKEYAEVALKSGAVENKNVDVRAEANKIYLKIHEHFGMEI